MGDFSFSLGLDCDLSDSDPQITPDRNPNHSSVAFEKLTHNDDEFETLVVGDSEPEYPDSHPKLKRLRRTAATSSSSSSVSAPSKLHSTAVVDDDVFTLQKDRLTDQHHHHVVCNPDPVSTSCNNLVFPKLIARGFQLTDSDSDSYDPLVTRKCNGLDFNSNLPQHVKRDQIVSKHFPKACRYFFHNDPRIQELVRGRLPNFTPLGNMLNIDLEQPSTSKIDYMGQFSIGGSSKQAAGTVESKKSSTSRRISRKLETEEMSQGWVNPKLGVDKVTIKGGVKRKVHKARQTGGRWLTGSDGKKVYVGKGGKELTGRVAYIQYKKESGSGFKRVKRKFVTKKKK